MTKNKEIAKYMDAHGLPYEMEYPGNVYHAIASAGSQVVVMAHTYYETDTGKHKAQYFVGYYPTVMEARDIQRGILNAKPRKRFVQSVIVVNGNN